MGEKKKEVCYGHPDFLSSFWPSDIWSWDNLNKNPKNLKASDYTGPGTFTGFLKEVVRRRLNQLKIDPEDYVSEKFTEKQRVNRQKKRGKSFPAIVSPDIEEPVSIEEEQDDETEAPVEPQVSLNEDDSDGLIETATETTEVENPSNNVEDVTNNSNFTNVSQFSDLLASNNIDLNCSETLTNCIFETIPGNSVPNATSTWAPAEEDPRHLPSPPRPNIVSSATLQVDRPNTANTFKPRRPRPAELNEIPGKEPKRRCTPAPPRPAPPPPSHSMVRRSSKPRQNQIIGNFKSNISVNMGPAKDPDTQIHVPQNLIDVFNSACFEQTQEGFEVVGVLAGYFDEDESAYKVSHAIVPQQRPSAIGWLVDDERQLSNFFTTHPDLLFLGFVHSQPLTGILTSLHLHSLVPYAIDNPVVVSVVISPHDRTLEAFSLTTLGIEELTDCTKTGLHSHKHSVVELTREATNVVNDETRDIDFVDYRLRE